MDTSGRDSSQPPLAGPTQQPTQQGFTPGSAVTVQAPQAQAGGEQQQVGGGQTGVEPDSQVSQQPPQFPIQTPQLPQDQTTTPQQSGASSSQPELSAIPPAQSVIQGRPAGAKEAEFVSGEPAPLENIPVVEIREPGELSPEVSGWIERAEHDQVPEPAAVVHQGKTYAQPATPQNVQVTLPLDQTQIKQGLHHKIIDSVRWLAEWCMRLVRKYKGEVGYRNRE